MQALGIRAESIESLQKDIDLKKQNGFSPTLAIVFASVSTDIEALQNSFADRPFSLFGASSGGEILLAHDGLSVARASIAGLLLDLPDKHFAVKNFESENLSSFQLGENAGKWAQEKYRKPAILLVSAGLTADGEGLIQGIQSITGEDTIIYGALAADDMMFHQTYVFDQKSVLQSGILICAIDTDRIEAGGIASHGWQSIGTKRKITSAEGNRVYTIDDKPALDFYKEYIGVQTAEELPMALEFPLQVEREGSPAVLRAVVGIEEDGSLIFNGNVKNHSDVSLSAPPGPTVIDHTIHELDEYREKFPKADVGILFHCAVRHHALGEEVEREIVAAGKYWDIPIAGIFSYGEIGELKGGHCDFHAATYSLFLMRDKEADKKSETGIAWEDINDNLANEAKIARKEFETIETSLAKLQENRKISLKELEKTFDRFLNLRSHFRHYEERIERLSRHHFTKSALLTKTSSDLQNKISTIEELNRDLNESNQIIDKERTRSEQLLLNILPADIAVRIKHGEKHIAERLENVAVGFIDIAGFTTFATKTDPENLVRMLDRIFTEFDSLAQEEYLEKIKTIGDSYMVAAGVPVPHNNPVHAMARFSLKVLQKMKTLANEFTAGEMLHVRIGIHTGEVVAGVIGENKFSYDLWGDTVNTASRMESHSEPGRIQCSKAVYEILKDDFRLTPRGKIRVKGKEEMETFFIEGNK